MRTPTAPASELRYSGTPREVTAPCPVCGPEAAKRRLHLLLAASHGAKLPPLGLRTMEALRRPLPKTVISRYHNPPPLPILDLAGK